MPMKGRFINESLVVLAHSCPHLNPKFRFSSVIEGNRIQEFHATICFTFLKDWDIENPKTVVRAYRIEVHR